MTLSLVGYRAVGKSTVGRILAARLGWAFLDTDEEVERLSGLPIARLWGERGEAAFRDLEAGAVLEAARRAGTVIAAGGGAVLREASARALRAAGPVVWLRLGAEGIARRLRADPRTPTLRPPLAGVDTAAEVEALLYEREAAYRAAADLEVWAAGTPEEVATAVLAALPPGWRRPLTPRRSGSRPPA
ncbi:MAG: shikimate kinase [Planctomycetes bacterium]|nr:shikimate kinase [Planctomycetota bacterium]